MTTSDAVIAWASGQLDLLHRLNHKRLDNRISGSSSVPIRQHLHEYTALCLAVEGLIAAESPQLDAVLKEISLARCAAATYEWRISGHTDEGEAS